MTLVYTAYLALSLTDRALAISPLVRNSSVVSDVVAAQLRAAQAAGDSPSHLDPDLEATILLTRQVPPRRPQTEAADYGTSPADAPA